MKLLLMFLGFLFFVLGVVFTITLIGALIGIPMILVGLVTFVLGIILPIRL